MSALGLADYVAVRRAFGARPLHLHVLRPPYAALGVGTLRVLRVKERGEALDVVTGYDRYERLPAAT